MTKYIEYVTVSYLLSNTCHYLYHRRHQTQCVGIHGNIHATYWSYWLQRSAPSLCLDTGGYWLKSGNGAAYPPKPWVLWCPSLFRSFETTSQPCCPTQITTGLARTSQSQHVVPSVLNIHHLALEIWWEENLLWVLYLSGIGSQIDLPKLMNQVLAVVRKSFVQENWTQTQKKKTRGQNTTQITMHKAQHCNTTNHNPPPHPTHKHDATHHTTTHNATGHSHTAHTKITQHNKSEHMK